MLPLLLLDENVSALLERKISPLGFSTKRLPARCGDQFILQEARIRRAAIITRDKDFLKFSALGTKGILVIRIPAPDVAGMASSLKNLIQKFPPAKWKNKILLLEKKGFIIC